MQWNTGKQIDLSATTFTQEFVQDKLEGQGIDSYLAPKLSSLHDPNLLKGMSEAIQRSVQAIDSGEYVRLIPDYDADGITSCVSLMKLLTPLGMKISYDMPNRKEGYGLSVKHVDKAITDGCTLIITADNGIAAFEPIEYAKKNGIDVIVTDHHQPQNKLPDAIVINPHQEGCQYPFKDISGCVVAWKYAQALIQHLNSPVDPFQVLDMLAIGTVVDMMPIVNENRTLVYHGLNSIKEGKNKGLYQLMKKMELFKYDITSSTLSFSIGPALNASGRLGDASESVELFLSNSRIERHRIADYVCEINQERKQWTQEYSENVIKNTEVGEDPLLITYYPSIPEGIVGIVASKLLDVYNRPVLLFTDNDDFSLYKGSGRSVAPYNMFESLSKFKDLFISVGGHEAACGFAISPNNFDEVKSLLLNNCPVELEEYNTSKSADYHLSVEDMTMELAEEITTLNPFGYGNREPIFYLDNVSVDSYKAIGSNKNTLKLTVSKNKSVFSCIAFNQVEQFESVIDGVLNPKIDIMYSLDINEWRGRKTLQLNVKEIRLSNTE